jgi:transposase
MKKIAYIGVDYHIKRLSIGVMIETEKTFYDTIHIKNNDLTIVKYLKKLSNKFELKICYEASSSGYTFQRKLQSWGYHCDVIAPSLIPRKPGDRRKNDFRDARNLTRHYAQGLLTKVHAPSEEEESIRSLIRCRGAMKESQKRIKQQVNSFVLGYGIYWPKSKWTNLHLSWLWKLQLRDQYSQQVLEEYLGHLEYLSTRIEYLDEQIEQIAASPIYAPSVKKLRAFKGIGTLTAMLLIAEVTDFRRFATPRALMAFLGLIPSENSSGDKQGGASITKAGNLRCRKQLIESVQHYLKKPRISLVMKKKLQQVDTKSANIVIKSAIPDQLELASYIRDIQTNFRKQFKEIRVGGRPLDVLG